MIRVQALHVGVPTPPGLITQDQEEYGDSVDGRGYALTPACGHPAPARGSGAGGEGLLRVSLRVSGGPAPCYNTPDHPTGMERSGS